MQCQVCRREISDREPIYRVRFFGTIWAEKFGGRTISACTSCKERPPKGSEWAFRGPWYPALPCCSCDRPVFVDHKPKGLRVLVCSDRCRQAVYNARAYKPRCGTQKPCIICCEQFTPKRSDALYCSRACKQRVYRASTRRRQEDMDC